MSEKDLKYYMGLPYKMEIVPEEGGAGFNAMIPDLKGCMAFGETIAEALEVLDDIKQAWFELALQRGWHIPEPAVMEFPEYSGKFNVRLPRYLHRELAEMAEREDTSLNQLVVAFLSEGAERRRQECWSLQYAEQAEIATKVLIQQMMPAAMGEFLSFVAEASGKSTGVPIQIRFPMPAQAAYTTPLERKGDRG